MDTMTHADAAQAVLTDLGLKYVSLSRKPDGGFTASAYWPNGDSLRDKHCFGSGETLSDAISIMQAKVAAAALEGPILKTAAECKEAVLNLIREHDAAPASFRDAVDALPVKG